MLQLSSGLNVGLHPANFGVGVGKGVGPGTYCNGIKAKQLNLSINYRP